MNCCWGWRCWGGGGGGWGWTQENSWIQFNRIVVTGRHQSGHSVIVRWFLASNIVGHGYHVHRGVALERMKEMQKSSGIGEWNWLNNNSPSQGRDVKKITYVFRSKGTGPLRCVQPAAHSGAYQKSSGWKMDKLISDSRVEKRLKTHRLCKPRRGIALVLHNFLRGPANLQVLRSIAGSYHNDMAAVCDGTLRWSSLRKKGKRFG